MDMCPAKILKKSSDSVCESFECSLQNRKQQETFGKSFLFYVFNFWVVEYNFILYNDIQNIISVKIVR